MEMVIANLAGKTRRETLHGCEYLVAGATLIVPGVLNGSQGPLLYPADEVSKDPWAWNGMPLVAYHPIQNGQHVSARDPDILGTQGLGFFYRAKANGTLGGEAWFDVEATRNFDQKLAETVRLLPRLEKGEPIELSTGLHLDQIPGEGVHNGKAYTHTARNYRPDHIAVLPDAIGACVLPGQEIQGRIVKASKARYAGEAVRIRTASGEVLAVTANHPVLTERGFVPAGQLAEGQDLLHYVGENEALAADCHEQNAPALAEDVFEALERFAGVKKLVGASALDFHGDAAFFQGDVEVVSAKGALRDDGVAQPAQRFRQGRFRGGRHGQSPLARGSHSQQFFDGMNSSTAGLVSGGREALALAGSQPGVHQPRGLRAAAGDASFLQPVVNGRAVDAGFSTDFVNVFATDVGGDDGINEFLGNQLAGHPALADFRVFGPAAELDVSLPQLLADRVRIGAGRQGNVPGGHAGEVVTYPALHRGLGDTLLGKDSAVCFADDGTTGDEQLANRRTAEADLFRQLVKRFPGKVLTDKIIHVDRFHYVGPVYDFETATGYMVAEKLIVSNCSIQDGCGVLVNMGAKCPHCGYAMKDGEKGEKCPKCGKMMATNADLEPRTIWQKLGTLLGVTGNQLSHDDLRQQLGDLIAQRYGPVMSYVLDVFDKECVYRVGDKTYRLNYSTDLRTGQATLSDEAPVEVRKVTSYKPVANADPAILIANGYAYVPVSETNPHKEPDMASKLTDNDRKALVDYLVTNCDCWKGDKDSEVLNGFPDDKLTALKVSTEKAKANETLANAAQKGFEHGESVLAFNAQTGQWESKPKEKPAANTTAPQSPDKWFAAMFPGMTPAQVQAAVRNAFEMERKAKEDIIDKLTANLDADTKAKVSDHLRTKSLDELRVLAPLAPAVNQPSDPFAPSFFGAAAGFASNATQEPELLDLPVMNWSTK